MTRSLGADARGHEPYTKRPPVRRRTMFANVETVCAAARSYRVLDPVVRDHVLRVVGKAARRAGSVPAIDRDLRRAEGDADSKFAVNLSGQPCNVLLTRVDGVETSFLVEPRSRSVAVVPLRFTNTMYDGTVLRCTLLHRQRVMVVDAVASPGSLTVREVLRAHAADPMLFPARLVARREMSRGELLRAFDGRRLPGNCHSVSLLSRGPEAVFRAARGPR